MEMLIFFVEPDSNITDLRLSVEPTLLEYKDGIVQVVIVNSTGFTQRLNQNQVLDMKLFLQVHRLLQRIYKVFRYFTVISTVSIESWRQGGVCDMFKVNYQSVRGSSFVCFLWTITQFSV